jgi:hypothetical protein
VAIGFDIWRGEVGENNCPAGDLFSIPVTPINFLKKRNKLFFYAEVTLPIGLVMN